MNSVRCPEVINVVSNVQEGYVCMEAAERVLASGNVVLFQTKYVKDYYMRRYGCRHDTRPFPTFSCIPVMNAASDGRARSRELHVRSSLWKHSRRWSMAKVLAYHYAFDILSTRYYREVKYERYPDSSIPFLTLADTVP